MEIVVTRRDLLLSVAILGIFAGWVALSLSDNRQMHEELEALAEKHIEEWFTGGKVNREDYDYLAIVDAEKAFTLFGRGWGVVHTYFKRKDDAEFTTFKGVEFFYVRENGEWRMHDSAGCGAFEHHIRAFDAFMASGVHVPNKVYDRSLKIDFACDLSHLDASNAEDAATSGS
ncbi:MAG: hypothetical protein RLZZ303_308 [Candidatus Hydrogenedentota bacterium]